MFARKRKKKKKRHFRAKKKHVQRQAWQRVSRDSSQQFILFLYAYTGLPCYPKVEHSSENFHKKVHKKRHKTKKLLPVIYMEKFRRVPRLKKNHLS